MRDAVLDAARELAVARGWAKVRMEDVAAAAGVSRRTVYNEFGNRDGLGEAVIRREMDTFMADIRRVLDEQGDDVRAAVEAGVLFALKEASANPLVRSVLASRPGDSLLPYLTTNAEMILRSSMEVIEGYVQEHLPSLPTDRRDWGAEVLARLVLSNIVLPRAPADEVARELADIAVRFVIAEP